MNKQTWLALALLVPLAAAVPLAAQPARPGSAELPVQSIVLFNAGVGYFQREGAVDGNARVDLQFPVQSINDLIKSLVLQDLGGGTISTVHYDSRNPIERTLKSFAIDLTGDPSVGQLLKQARGERLEVDCFEKTVGGNLKESKLTGVIVGIDKQKHPVGNALQDVDHLNLLTADGVRSVPIHQIQRFRFLKPELEQEFRKALEVLALSHDTQRKSVSLHFTGTGRRQVRVGYVMESPMWKTSYRLALQDKDKVMLQGWAIVENTTDEDWKDVRLGLVAGRPISFQMDLYEPLFVPRPLIEPEIFASLRPPTYQGSLQQNWGKLPEPKEEKKDEPMHKNGGPGPSRVQRLEEKIPQSKDSRMQDQAIKRLEEARGGRMKFEEGIASAAISTDLGDYFQYLIEQPVSLPRQKSALIPIVNQAVEAGRVSIYNENVHEKYPLLGLRFKNATKLHLMQGPITVFDAGSYAGDGRIADLKPGETRLLSYAIDLGTEVKPETKHAPETLLAVKVVKGVLTATNKQRRTSTYVVKNRSENARKVIVEHPYDEEWKLVAPAKAAETARDVLRFELTAEPNKPVTLEVIEERTDSEQVRLASGHDETFQFFLKATQTSTKVKAALQKAIEMRQQLADTRKQIEKEEQAIKLIEQDQVRMRANMERVPPTSEAYKRYLKKFDDQETEIEKRRDLVVKLQETAEKQVKALEEYLAGLNVE